MDGPAIDLDDLLHPDEQRRFRALCLETSAAELAELGEQVPAHFEQMQAMASHVTDLETAERLSDALVSLIGDGTGPDGAGFDADERALIRGAAEYFMLLADTDDDLSNPIGFDDDVRVFNRVLDRLDRPERKIEPS
ncbi:MAG: hypothetical protein ACRBI6_13475 [Acidimicrobiales bacterium]